MSYLVLARKWRPQQFDDVIGQNHVVTTLKNAITMKRVAHAYLFCGPRGIGKTSIARIFAKALNCQKEMTVSPCDKCSNCTEISAGTSMDVLEIDGASNRGIDQVRELRENVKFTPASNRFKVYIIDEVHMLTPEAFNALLKTLEEPPAHVKFFFATTEAHKVPATILSRCQRFDLRKVSTSEIFKSIREIVKKEKLEADEKTLFAIAKHADGSLRDAQSLLDQLISFSGGNLKYEDAEDVLGWIPQEEVHHFIEGVKGEDWDKLFSLIREMDYQGRDLGLFMGELAHYLRDLLIIKSNPNQVGLIEATSEDLEKMKTQSQKFSKDQLLQMLEVSLDAEDRVKNALSKRAMLESLAVRLHLISRSVTLENLIHKIESMGIGGLGEGKMDRVKDRDIPPSKPQELSQEPPVKKNGLNPNSDINDPWEKVLGEMGEKPLIQTYLRDAVPYWEGERLKLLFPQNKMFSLEALKPVEHQETIQEAILKAYGVKATLELAFLPGESPKTNVEPIVASHPGAGAFQDDPVIQKALEMFGGKITEIKR